ncbi:hypothetical protein Goklo_005939 [Gossypium klotzschianum]|uniref:Xyloglucan endotransglucosylase/hydrolase n=1 Tax=Gossypium klotzschianum TaxID=34286 RepID=A0A7J8VFT9_9ROSI|nr:hypothetical protein [Gossypium klotzschianum]
MQSKMPSLKALLLALFIIAVVVDQRFVEANFPKSMYINWGAHHSSFAGNGEDLQLVLDQTSGSAVKSKRSFLFGSIEMLIKLVPGNSAGTVTAYYVSATVCKANISNKHHLRLSLAMLHIQWPFVLSTQVTSTGDKHDEIDFEFLGNVSGQPYIVHTNIYTQGNGSREQQFYLWFDPTADFHNYTIHWNPTEVVWYIDNLPIRVFRNYEKDGIAFPNKQGMRVHASLWNADNWATRGGIVKIDWNSSPFIARFRRFRARACKWDGQVSINQCATKSPANWWTSPSFNQLSSNQMGQLNWVRQNFMIYDYCKDTKRFNGQIPPECFKQQF